MGAGPRKGGGGLDVEACHWCAPGTSARQCQCWGLPALNLLRDPRNVGFTTGHYLVLLQLGMGAPVARG